MVTTLMIFAAGACLAIDGDTVECQGERIRLARINAPELSEPGGAESSDWLGARIEGKRVFCTVSDRREKYGRLLGDCYAEAGPSLGDRLLDAGLAEPYRGRK